MLSNKKNKMEYEQFALSIVNFAKNRKTKYHLSEEKLIADFRVKIAHKSFYTPIPHKVYIFNQFPSLNAQMVLLNYYDAMKHQF